MELLKRLSDYDLFGHLVQGILAFAAWDLLTGSRFVVGADWNVADAILILLGAYIAGHVLASPASWLLERTLVKSWLGDPAVWLFPSRRPPWWRRVMFGDYVRPLPEPVQTAALAKLIAPTGAPRSAETLFWGAYPAVRADPVGESRLRTFTALYGFSRNVSFVALSTAVALVVSEIFTASRWSDLDGQRLQVAAFSGLVGIAMFYRFLKYYRLFSVEVFTVYARMA